MKTLVEKTITVSDIFERLLEILFVEESGLKIDLGTLEDVWCEKCLCPLHLKRDSFGIYDFDCQCATTCSPEPAIDHK
jgi:hypothetical protein